MSTSGEHAAPSSSLKRRIAQQREGLIVRQAAPYLADGERVLRWVRARNVDGRGDGFAFLTESRVIVHWTGRSDAPGAFEWHEITAWGVVSDARGGPILGIETGAGTCTVQLRATTRAMAQRVAEFVEQFSARTPSRREPMDLSSPHGPFTAVRSVDVPSHRMTTAEKAKRIGWTVLGATLVVGGMVLTPLPGPWSFPIVLAGLAILSKEYDWAKDAMEWTKEKSRAVASRFRARRGSG